MKNRVMALSGDASGSVAIIFGICLMVLSMAIGLSIDSARAYNVKSKIQSALDAAALAGAKQLDPDDYDVNRVKQAAAAYFNERVKELNVAEITLSDFDAIPNVVERTVATKVRVRMNSMFGSLTNLSDQIDFTPTSKTKFVARKVEIALVLDVTGSMAGTRMADLKTAAKEMVDALYSSYPQPGAIKISLVPYSAAVNLGGHFNGSVAVVGGASDTCVIEREGVNTYTNAAPTAGSLFETTGNTDPTWLNAYMCPAATIVPLTDLVTTAARDSFKAQIDAMSPGGWTAGHIGLAWGWYTISPEWASVWSGDSVPKPYREDVEKVVVLMTDGMFNTSYWNDGYQYNGASYDVRREDPTIPGTSSFQALQLCESIKDRTAQPLGPKIYTVSFQAPPAADALMAQCAGAGNAYTAESRASLIAAFKDIVDRLNSLRVTS